MSQGHDKFNYHRTSMIIIAMCNYYKISNLTLYQGEFYYRRTFVNLYVLKFMLALRYDKIYGPQIHYFFVDKELCMGEFS